MSKSTRYRELNRNTWVVKERKKSSEISGFIKLGSFNIQGSVDKKLNFNDVKGLIDHCDISFIQETWFTESSVMSETNSNMFRSDRKKNKKAAGSGGVCAIFKTRVRPGLQKINSKVADFMWMKLHKTFFGLEKDL